MPLTFNAHRYNPTKRRAKTLVEQHQERQEKERKAGKARAKAERKAGLRPLYSSHTYSLDVTGQA